MTKLTVTFRNFTNAPKNGSSVWNVLDWQQQQNTRTAMCKPFYKHSEELTFSCNKLSLPATQSEKTFWCRCFKFRMYTQLRSAIQSIQKNTRCFNHYSVRKSIRIYLKQESSGIWRRVMWMEVRKPWRNPTYETYWAAESKARRKWRG